MKYDCNLLSLFLLVIIFGLKFLSTLELFDLICVFTALAKLRENEDESIEEDAESFDSTSDLMRRKSAPAIRYHMITGWLADRII